MRYRDFITLLATMVLVTSCGSPKTPGERRSAHHQKSKGDIVIGFTGPWEMGGAEDSAADAVKGLDLALDEINAAGGIGGRRLSIIRLSDGGSLEKAYKVAPRFADNMDICAVIGHESSYISIPLSIIYEYYGILMITPFSTNPNLTDKGFRLVFRCVPNDNHIGDRLALLSSQKGFKRVLIYHADDMYGRGIANAFESGCQKYGIEVPDRQSFAHNSLLEMHADLAFWRDNFDFDAIFIGAYISEATAIIKIAADLKLQAALLGPEQLDSQDLLKMAGDSAEGFYVASLYNPAHESDVSKHFFDAFSKRYGYIPDPNAAQSYETLKVLAHAIGQAESTDPFRIADAMREIRWDGMTGSVSFDERGEREDAHIIVKQVKEGKFVTLD